MRKIIVGFSTHSGAFSWLIRTVTKSKISHCYSRMLVPEHETTMVFQASGLVVNYCNGDLFDSNNVLHGEYEVEVSDEQWVEAERLRVTEAGKPYSMRQLCGYLWVLLMRKLGKKVSNPLADGTHAHVCVEILARMIGLNDPESMTPEDLRRWCEKNGKLIATS